VSFVMGCILYFCFQSFHFLSNTEIRDFRNVSRGTGHESSHLLRSNILLF